jgi:hypothetical protein
MMAELNYSIILHSSSTSHSKAALRLKKGFNENFRCSISERYNGLAFSDQKEIAK